MTAHMHSMLARLAKLRLMAKTRRLGAHKGRRQANKFGTSLEFSDYRLYQPGDDVRQIDWNIYGRTHKHYIKRFLDEQELAITVFLDVSGSMQAIETKWARAKELAASFSFIALSGEDRLSFVPVSSEPFVKVSRKGSVYAKKVFFDILQFPLHEGSGTFTENLHKNSLKNNQLAILITDGLEPLESFESLFRSIAARKQEVTLIQLLSRDELNPIYTGDVKLIDSESKESVQVSMNEFILGNYQRQLNMHNHKLELLCRRFGFSYLMTTDHADLPAFLFHECSAKRMLY
ncbi:DUF58 domain-containing protein [Bacillus sp. S3]|uniref:DUF58 domain-containing protein n=1 Tax=Bacillus sp. S3 TaxID=486398 RepID=UPI00118C601A|nr:DUF58 domain-containing protein [Bacillus sp. S3]QCJ42035.1 DUF58 domain-containing protein [Bacillus sp. S3]